MRQYLEFVADQRLVMLGLQRVYGAKNPFSFMDLQDVQELANFFERRVSAYQVAVAGEVSFSRGLLEKLFLSPWVRRRITSSTFVDI